MNHNRAQDMDTENNAQGKKRRIVRWTLIVILAVLLIGAGLMTYAYFEERDEAVAVIPTPTVVVPTPMSTATATATPTPTATATPTPTATATPTPTATPYVNQGMFGANFPSVFTDGDIIKTDQSYKSEDISIEIEQVQEDGITYYAVDIYVRNLRNFQTAFAGGDYGGLRTDRTLNMAIDNDAVLAVSGDYYRARSEGIVIRNGVLYRDNIYKDILIMNDDGSMQTFSPEEFDVDTIMDGGAYQGWSFGPILLDNGQPIEEFHSNVSNANPRCGIGYYEPGHYCFVLVDGRQSGYSKGMTLVQFSQLFYELGCSVAYNMDGGYSAAMVYDGELESHPAKGGRRISDIVYIAEVQE